ncbi:MULTISPECIES: hypothetical protein [Chromohalobacter]|uniref:hypothetical protein n=1 Tax=Chromohalobacter TaxID=42054 RepID=UPI00240F5DA7|nr:MULTISPECIES: hypothetical protein [Chromohalobacter]MDV6318777.1 hypothetical protein [Chromohalobacter sp. HP20-39]
MSIPATSVFKPRELEALRRQGIVPLRYFFSTGEVLVEIDGQPHGVDVDFLRRRANPGVWNRVVNWLIGRAA